MAPIFFHGSTGAVLRAAFLWALLSSVVAKAPMTMAAMGEKQDAVKTAGCHLE